MFQYDTQTYVRNSAKNVLVWIFLSQNTYSSCHIVKVMHVTLYLTWTCSQKKRPTDVFRADRVGIDMYIYCLEAGHDILKKYLNTAMQKSSFPPHIAHLIVYVNVYFFLSERRRIPESLLILQAGSCTDYPEARLDSLAAVLWGSLLDRS